MLDEIINRLLLERVKNYSDSEMHDILHALKASEELQLAITIALRKAEKLKFGTAIEYLLGWSDVRPEATTGMYHDKSLPDIDVDFADDRRDMVFAYAEQKYGADRVARLGTVSLFKPRSALKQAGGALRIPTFMVERALEGVIERSGGDSRAMMALEDTLNSTEMGRRLVAEFPNAMLAARLEGHPDNASQHAAGIVLTEQPIAEYVAVDARTNAAMCDKKDAEELNLLKIDALGLTQLSIFQRCLELMGKPSNSAAGFLEGLPLDDQKAFEVLNSGKFSGIFQFTGTALKSLCRQVKVESLEDMIAMTALARPGPMASGGTGTWTKRRRGEEQAATVHPMLTELTKETFGVVVYQEQVLKIVREMGNMSWADTSAIRKAMSGRLGDEFFEGYKRKFMAGAVTNGVEEGIADEVWRQVNTMGSWCLSGSTRIRLAREIDGIKAPTIRELFNWSNAGRLSKKVNLHSLYEDGRIRWNRLGSVVKSGKKVCWEFDFADGSKVICTPEHKFIINGEWKEIGSARIGDEFLRSSVKDSRKKHYRQMKASDFKGKKYKKKQEGFPTGENHPLFISGVHYYLKEFRERMKGLGCADCGGISGRRMEAHHNDFADGSIRPNDLTWLCSSCHATRHRKFGSRMNKGERGLATCTTALVSKRRIGLKETYDISMPLHHNFMLDNGLITHNSFNRSHAVAYGIVSYWCCWLKAHYPMEFAAATLDAEKDPVKQLTLLRELAAEGIDYVAVDPLHSTERWSFKREGNSARLIGPLTMINGIGPAAMKEIIECRKRGVPLRAVLAKKLEAAHTKIDQLWPIRAAAETMLKSGNVVSLVTPISQVQPGRQNEVCVVGVFSKIAPKDENEAVNVMKRGGQVLTGPTDALNLFLRDDEDEIFCKVNRFKFNELGRPIIERGGVGKALYAIKGTVPRGFRMISINAVRYLGDIN